MATDREASVHEEDLDDESVSSSDDLPIVPGLTETIEDSGPTFEKLYSLMMRQGQATSQTLITHSISLLHDAMEREPNPMMQARLAVMLSMLNEGPDTE